MEPPWLFGLKRPHRTVPPNLGGKPLPFMSRPFDGLRVLDLTHVLAGPFCTYLLALLGAETIKIEAPGEPDEVRGRGVDPELNARLMGTNYQTQGANKKAITLNIKTGAGQRILKQLAENADVFVENYRTGALA